MNEQKKIKTYSIYAKVVGSKYIGEVEAESEDQAIEKAEEHPNAYISLCHQCSHHCEDAEIEEFTAEVWEERI